MSNFAEACKLSYEDWVAKQPDIESLPDPEYSEKHTKRMEKLFDQMRGNRYHRFTRRTVRVMVAAAVLAALTLTAFSIPSSREFIIENFDIFGVYEMTEHNNNCVSGEIEAGYIPEGYELVETDNQGKFITNIYETKDGEIFVISKNASSLKSEINIENITEAIYNVLGIQYTCFKNSSGFSCITWIKGDYIYQINGLFSYDELLEIAQAVK